ncbi:TPA: hypothetical protein ACGSTL_001175 [Vibrio parahaemolyticus]|uniref:hypothetical protein n=1 Tax=Vibrio campbellii TaxID=680 RepID=UPI001F0717A4|nr:hypothetical protein [Vibrio campbellii]UMM06598.1 hypothetical protein MKR81_26995 [Vibrio campbellii]
MIHKQLLSSLLFSITLCATTTASATELQRVISDVEYQLSDLDTPSTARMHALKKARTQAISLAESDYAITTKVNGDGVVNEDSDFSLGLVVSENVLSEEMGECTTLKLKGQLCYHLQLEAMVDAGYVSPTLEQLAESEKALRLVEDLLSQ